MILAVLAILLCCSALPAQVAGGANAEYQTKEGRARLGKGLGSSGRDAQQKPKELVEALDLKPGMTVADVGSGVGYMLPHLSRAVGPSGRVLAEDIQQDFLDGAKTKAERDKLDNVSYVLGSTKDTKLPAGAVDVAFALDAYHHFDYPAEMLASIRKALKKDGRLAVVDFHKNHFKDSAHIRLDLDGLIQEVEANGFRCVSRREFPSNDQFLAVFVKRAAQ